MSGGQANASQRGLDYYKATGRMSAGNLETCGAGGRSPCADGVRRTRCFSRRSRPMWTSLTLRAGSSRGQKLRGTKEQTSWRASVADNTHFWWAQNNAPLTQRNILVRAQTMKDISLKTSTTLTQKGKYYNDEDLANRKEEDEIPLSIEVMGTDKEKIKEAEDAIKEIMNDTPLPDPRALSKQLALGEGWTNKKVFVELEANPMPGFSVIGKLLGPRGSFLKHITSTTQARVELRGRGSQGTSYTRMHGEKDADLGLHLDISARSKQGCEEAERLC